MISSTAPYHRYHFIRERQLGSLQRLMQRGCRAKNHDSNTSPEAWLDKNSIYLKKQKIIFPMNSISYVPSLKYFPYVLTTFLKDVRLSWTKTLFFLYLAHSTLFMISLLTYYFLKDVRLSHNKFCFL